MSSPQWLALRGALGETAGRFARLLVAVGDPDADARAVGTWSVGDVAAHVHEVSIIDVLFHTGPDAATYIQPQPNRSGLSQPRAPGDPGLGVQDSLH